MPPDFLSHLGGEVGPAIKHSQCHAENLQTGIEPLFYHPQCGHEITQTFQCVVFALHRHQNPIGGAQAIQCQQFQGRGAVHENHIVVGFYLLQCFFQLQFPVLCGNQFHCRTCQVCRSGQHVTVVGGDDGFFRRYLIDDHIVDGVFDFPLVQTHAGGGIGLRVKVTEQNLLSQFLQGSRQVHGGGGFAHAAFLIDYGNYFTHFSLLMYLNVSRETLG